MAQILQTLNVLFLIEPWLVCINGTIRTKRKKHAHNTYLSYPSQKEIKKKHPLSMQESRK